jgi:hypothetical protein
MEAPLKGFSIVGRGAFRIKQSAAPVSLLLTITSETALDLQRLIRFAIVCNLLSQVHQKVATIGLSPGRSLAGFMGFEDYGVSLVEARSWIHGTSRGALRSPPAPFFSVSASTQRWISE